ncbi:Tat pathway signal protein [Sphingomonas hengshuiensis]|uniref:Tat pathway signal protein n=1 Tax=Sphingomonas hengshuiensis TaxID=1609977 RepID=A0A7U4J8U0_9SPHN|nr:Tat pathway signal protein [Sphingomonas hengshuiensis]
MNRRQMLVGAGATVAVAGATAYATLSAMGSPSDYAEGIASLRAPLAHTPSGLDLVRYATLAPNGHNTQPWRFRLGAKRIEILPDFSRRTPVVDPDDHHLFVSLGCAAENLSLASAARGAPGVVGFDPRGGVVRFDFERAAAIPSAMFDAIGRRQSTRGVYDGRGVDTATLTMLAKAVATVPGVGLVLMTDRTQIDRLRDLVLAGNDAQMADDAFVRELKSWLRFNPQQALRTRDGLYSVASGNPALPDWLGPPAFDWFSTAQSQNEQYARQIRSSAGIAVFVGAGAHPEHWVRVGQACQRFALQATALGMKHAFLNQPVEVPRLRPELASLVGLPGRRPDIVIRFGYGPATPWSARRRAESVIIT